MPASMHTTKMNETTFLVSDVCTLVSWSSCVASVYAATAGGFRIGTDNTIGSPDVNGRP